MKPNFALTLSFDGIALLHRAFPGWHLVGDVSPDSEALTADLTDLRDKAQALDASGLRSKLVLPDEQIKYLQIDAPDGTDPGEAVREALIGATPYAVDDLAFDYTVEAGKIFIAAVAKETLDEAEDFAVLHRFNPVSFVAMPVNGEFVGEPFFGATRHIAAEGVTSADIKRDMAPIRVIGATKLAEVVPQDPPASPLAPSETASIETAPAETPDADYSEPDPVANPAMHPQAQTEPHREDVQSHSERDSEAETDPVPEAPAVAAFSSIRASRGDVTETTPPRLDGVSRNEATARITLGPAGEIDPPDSATNITGMSEVAIPEDEAPANDIHPDIEERLTAPSQRVATAPEDQEDTPVAAPTAPTASFFTRRQRDKTTSAAESLKPDREDERQRLTIFGAREQTAVRGKPRFLGLILTAVLLLFLVGVAAWASIFMDEGLARFFRANDTPVVASVPEEKADEIESGFEEEVTEEADIELASLQPNEPLSVRDDPATEILSRVTPRDLSPDEAMARYAATGIWQLAPDPPAIVSAAEMEDFFQTTLDEAPDFTDAVALPATANHFSDGIFFTPPSPPAADTTFVLDSRGFVQASASGALTPDGVRVFAGRPAVVPPGGAAGRVDVPQDATPETAAETARLATLRPRVRPEDAAEQIERDGLSGRTLSELAAMRPKLRPESAQEAAANAEETETANIEDASEAATAARASTVDLAALEGAVAEAVAEPDPFDGATAEAVQASLKPNTRPRNFDNIVQRTIKSQERQAQRAEAEQQPVRVAAAQKVTPKIPSAASVSKAATERRALKFQRVNLIGVYGTQTNRRALVRMSNGRYQKVKVGDRLDGGRVNAIGESELRYQKGGRNIVLTMPRG